MYSFICMIIFVLFASFKYIRPQSQNVHRGHSNLKFILPNCLFPKYSTKNKKKIKSKNPVAMMRIKCISTHAQTYASMHTHLFHQSNNNNKRKKKNVRKSLIKANNIYCYVNTIIFPLSHYLFNPIFLSYMVLFVFHHLFCVSLIYGEQQPHTVHQW